MPRGRGRIQTSIHGVEQLGRDLKWFFHSKPIQAAGVRYIADLEPEHVCEFVTWARTQLKPRGDGTYSDSTIRRACMAVATLYRRAKQHHLVKYNPVSRNDCVPSTRDRGEASWLEPLGVLQIIEAVPAEGLPRQPYARAMIAYLAYTGCRPDEMRRALLSDADPEKKEIVLRGTKNKGSFIRRQPYWTHLKEILAEDLDRHPRPAGCPWLFPSFGTLQGTEPCDHVRDLRATWMAVVKLAVGNGLVKEDSVRRAIEVTPYTLRHSWASTIHGLVQRTPTGELVPYDSWRVATMMGHMTATTLDQVYSHAQEGRLLWEELDYRLARGGGFRPVRRATRRGRRSR